MSDLENGPDQPGTKPGTQPGTKPADRQTDQEAGKPSDESTGSGPDLRAALGDATAKVSAAGAKVTAAAGAISPAWRGRLRAGATLLVLALVMFVAVRVGLDRVAEPFPVSEDPPICTTTDVQAGEAVTRSDVTVSVLNGGGADGLAGRTLSELVDRGFGRGQLDDAPDGTPTVAIAEIWTTEGVSAAVKLVQSSIQGRVRVVDRQASTAGITVVVGEDFRQVKNGRRQFRAQGAETTCVPTVPVETPVPDPADGDSAIATQDPTATEQ